MRDFARIVWLNNSCHLPGHSVYCINYMVFVPSKLMFDLSLNLRGMHGRLLLPSRFKVPSTSRWFVSIRILLPKWNCRSPHLYWWLSLKQDRYDKLLITYIFCEVPFSSHFLFQEMNCSMFFSGLNLSLWSGCIQVINSSNSRNEFKQFKLLTCSWNNGPSTVL